MGWGIITPQKCQSWQAGKYLASVLVCPHPHPRHPSHPSMQALLISLIFPAQNLSILLNPVLQPAPPIHQGWHTV